MSIGVFAIVALAILIGSAVGGHITRRRKQVATTVSVRWARIGVAIAMVALLAALLAGTGLLTDSGKLAEMFDEADEETLAILRYATAELAIYPTGLAAIIGALLEPAAAIPSKPWRITALSALSAVMAVLIAFGAIYTGILIL